MYLLVFGCVYLWTLKGEYWYGQFWDCFIGKI